MKRIDYIKSRNMDEIVDWITTYGQFDGSPWMNWFDDNYCKKCEPIMVKLSEECRKELKYLSSDEIECSYCELEHKCRFFQELNRDIDNKDIVKMWLEQDI